MWFIDIYERVSCYLITSKKDNLNDRVCIEERLELKIKNLKNVLKTSNDKQFLDSIQDEIKALQGILTNLKKGKK